MIILLTALIVLTITTSCCGLPFNVPMIDESQENQIIGPAGSQDLDPLIINNETVKSEPSEKLSTALAGNIWESILENFTFEPELTERVSNMSLDITAQFPDHYNIQWHVFTFSGIVDEAYNILYIPSDAYTDSPFDNPIDDVLRLFLYLWEPEIEAARGTSWMAEADSRIQEWGGLEQRMAEMSFLRDAYDGDMDTTKDNHDPFITWHFSIVSPIIDLDELTLIEGTYLIITSFQYKD